MHKKIAKRKKEISIPTKNIVGILIANAIGLVILFILLIICSMILQRSQTLTENLAIYFTACAAIGSFFNGFTAAKKCTVKGLISGLLTALPYAFIITVIMLFFTKGQLQPTSLILYVAVILSSVTGGICSANTRRRR